MKTEKELNALKEELESLHEELKELTGEELQAVAGGDFENGVWRFEKEAQRYHTTVAVQQRYHTTVPVYNSGTNGAPEK